MTKSKEVSQALVQAQTAERIAFANFVSASGDPESLMFADALRNPDKNDMDIKCIAISCGMDLVSLSQMFKRAALAEAMMKVSTTIATKVNNVVESALDAATDVTASDKDRRLALEVCGVIEAKGANKINLNLNQDIGTNHGYENAARTGTKVLEIDSDDKPPSHKKKSRLEVED